jgi:biotin transporter BioY
MGESFLVGMLVGFVIGATLVGWLWNRTTHDENDQRIK